MFVRLASDDQEDQHWQENKKNNNNNNYVNHNENDSDEKQNEKPTFSGSRMNQNNTNINGEEIEMEEPSIKIKPKGKYFSSDHKAQEYVLSPNDEEDDNDEANNNDNEDDKLKDLNNPAISANFLSKLFYSWVTPLVDIGYRTTVNETHLFPLPKRLEADHCTNILEQAWEKEKLKGRFHPFAFALFNAFRSEYFVPLVYIKLLMITLLLIRPFLLRELLSFITSLPMNGDEGLSLSTYFIGFFWCLSMGLVTLLHALALHAFYWKGVRYALTARAAIIGLLFKKSMALSIIQSNNTSNDLNLNKKKKSKKNGKKHKDKDFAAEVSSNTSNMASVDADNLMMFLWASINELWASPVLVIFCMSGLLIVLGLASLVGLAVLVLSLIATGKLAHYMSSLQQRMMKVADSRVARLIETVGAIKLIKLYAWENVTKEKIDKVRAEQESAIGANNRAGAFNRCLGTSVPLFVSLSSFTCYVLFPQIFGRGLLSDVEADGNLDATTAFVSLLLFSMLREPLSKTPEAVNLFIRCLVSVRRMEEFLMIPDRNNYINFSNNQAQRKNKQNIQSSQPSVSLVDASFAWYKDNGHIKELTVSVEPSKQSMLSLPPISPSPYSQLSIHDPISDLDSNTDPSSVDSKNKKSHSFFSKKKKMILQNIPENESQFKLLTAESSELKENNEDENELEEISAQLQSSSALSRGLLHDIVMNIGKGELCMVIGPVGSGKSSLIHALLGEILLTKGQVHLNSEKIAYTSQVSWLQSASIKQNITFGLPFDEKKYKETLFACALERDLSLFEQGDQTLVGERGINLSGGQKQRISLARAVYSGAEIYLLDEPLSAVDSHVAKWLWDHVLGPTGVLRNSVRILVTHQIQFCGSNGVGQIFVMEDGRILHRGSYNQLRSLGIDFEAIVEKSKGRLDEESDIDVKEAAIQREISLGKVQPHSKETPSSAINNAAIDDFKQEINFNDSPGSNENGVDYKELTEAPSKVDSKSNASSSVSKNLSLMSLSDAEESAQGTVSSSTYKEYFNAAAGTFGWILVAILVIISQGATVASDYFLAQWSSAQSYSNVTSTVLVNGTFVNGSSISATLSRSDQMVYVLNYGLLVGASSILYLIRLLYVARATEQAASTLHSRLLNAVLFAPQWFFDSTPSGRILNRCGKDQEMCDAQLPNVVQDVLACSVVVLGIVFMIIYIAPLSAIPLFFIGLLYYYVQNYYRPVSRDLKRMESVSRSPIYQHFSEANTGLITIRAYAYNGAVTRAVDSLYTKINTNTRLYYLMFAVNRWVGVRLEIVGALVVLSASAMALVLYKSLGVGLVALCVTVTLSLSGNLNWMVRQISEMEVQMNAVERIVEYTKIKSEEEELHQVESKKANLEKLNSVQQESNNPEIGLANVLSLKVEPSPSWPERGSIRFENVTVAYKPVNSPPVIKNLTADIRPGERIGIVGRTGAGKSTTSLALFRLLPSLTGRIIIDGIDISTIPVYTLRSRLAIIPQDPILFQDTIRKNIDANGILPDNEIWKILESLSLEKVVRELAGGLDFVITNESSFSLGQRQLFCLARAVVKKSQIILMDEATSSLDFQTDQLIRQLIRTKFKQCTLLTIAHRLGSVMDGDRIMVFDQGKLVEFDSPQNLLKNPTGFLSRLVADTDAADKH